MQSSAASRHLNYPNRLFSDPVRRMKRSAAYNNEKEEEKTFCWLNDPIHSKSCAIKFSAYYFFEAKNGAIGCGKDKRAGYGDMSERALLEKPGTRV